MLSEKSNTQKPRIYLFSGLGVAERAFQKLDFSGYECILIRWTEPLQRESMAAYALRLCKQVPDKDPILVGISFGGMVAIEVAKHLHAAKVILIASAKTRTELPGYYRLAGKLGLPHIVPATWIKHPNAITYWFFGVQLPEERRLLKQILNDTDPAFLKWALVRITTWKNETVPPGLLHIHGTSDRILPPRKIGNATPVRGGGHFMTITMAEEVSAVLSAALNS